jgi:malonate transporter and related proteins
MLDILAITGPIYITIAIGYLAVRYGAFDKAHTPILGQFVMRFALPAMLFTALVSRPLTEVIQPSFLAVYGLASLAMAALTAAVMRARQTSWPSIGIYCMGTSCSNSGFVGFPIALIALGNTAGVAVAQIFLIENLIMLPLLIALTEHKANDQQSLSAAAFTIAKRTLSNPLVLAIILGLLCALLGLHLPTAFAKVVSLFASASAGLSLFVIGGSLVGLSLASVRKPVSAITLSKLIGHPLLVFAGLMAIPTQSLSPELRSAALLFAAMPMMGVFPIFAQKTGQQGLAAACVLAGTVASFFTVTALLWGMRVMGWLA